ncbi:MAG TPA: SDR family NAD(P)-dependent oxidoreductase [Acidimicrobiia bacterium]|nr:SDR family NAD(P)-dependent oxidoreductase [Acidimicrobiia bacterium]
MVLDPASALLTDKVAVVTGAAMGIGEAIAITFAHFGADVAICDRDVPRLDDTANAIEATGRRVVAAELDVRGAAAARLFLETVRDELGPIDVLVNNAGGGFQSRLLDVSAKGEDALVHENFTSVTNFVRGVVPLMPEAGGSIINITSIEAHRAGPGFAVYSAMKAAVANLTKSLALELGDRNIRVNCIAPDVIPTPGTGWMAVTTPLPRAGHVDDVAGAAVYLASDMLSGFVTGTTLHVDGGNFAAGGWHRGSDGTFTT